MSQEISVNKVGLIYNINNMKMSNIPKFLQLDTKLDSQYLRETRRNEIYYDH